MCSILEIRGTEVYGAYAIRKAFYFLIDVLSEKLSRIALRRCVFVRLSISTVARSLEFGKGI